MKVKLLKKMRKRFSIEHFENGAPCYDDIFKGEFIVLWDRDNNLNAHYEKISEGNTVKEAVSKCKKRILEILEKDYYEIDRIIRRRCKLISKKIYP